MYGVGSLRHGQREHLQFMVQIGRVDVWIAFAARLVVALGMVDHLIRRR
ncbi:MULTISPECIES: hypothetical protein [unclassified Pseudofrankia]|nr:MULTISPECIES: hypothetical protein [unclassified Pseudofrankia]MDT3446682.1 hypothetical protein [Pseudofrankia sp. BMG5.37]